MNTMVYIFSEWLQQELTSRNLSQSDLARKTSLTRGAISHLVNGRNQPTANTCKEIATAFNYPLDHVLRVSGLLPPDPKSGTGAKIPGFAEYMAELEQLLALVDQRDRDELLAQARLKFGLTEKRQRPKPGPGELKLSEN